MVCTGSALAAALKVWLIIWMAQDRLKRSSVLYWRPDRTHIFGPARLHELDRPMKVPPLELLRAGVPHQAAEKTDLPAPLWTP